MPILVIHAQKDHGFQRLLRSSYRAADENSMLTIKPPANAGHLANPDQPEAMNRIVEEFLSRNR